MITKKEFFILIGSGILISFIGTSILEYYKPSGMGLLERLLLSVVSMGFIALPASSCIK